MATQQQVIKNFMAALDQTSSKGTAALDAAIKACSYSQYTSIQTVINKMVSDCRSAGNYETFLRDYCGIILDNDDTGAITGSDAGGYVTKTAESIVPEYMSEFVNYTGNSFTSRGLNFQLSYIYEDSDKSEHYSNRSFGSLNNSEKVIWQALYSWYAPKALDLIAESYGSNFGFDSYSSATVKTIHVGFLTQYDNTLAYVTNWSNPYYGTASDLDLIVNLKYYSDFSVVDMDGGSANTSFVLDRTIAHEFTHAAMAANINFFSKLPAFIKEGMAELTCGIDDERKG